MQEVVAMVTDARDVVWIVGTAILGVVLAVAVFCWFRSLIKSPTASRGLPASGRPTGHKGDTCL